ncbi:uncharacterized protein FOMMEDRAFT_28685 [Fomitiporia mediterranea MF3/22]|uniref:uncharacterized protein n=1 Tax=Fomitiporia mediterranea (strain MF3/22) TaxID=694068 RepID=UPI000440839E|nr:uncharacterized protein FOMMEDRAFT_28685 [Fomitiporia mediterranea MF3/22]EJD03102.1 hypothetical protein FOMMEDRAFT_28685 [Fomitiporia mediterranea MF3/22]
MIVNLGVDARPDRVHVDLLNFLKQEIPVARYVLSVCTGSWILAGTGVLDGKQATTNKFSFKSVKTSHLRTSSGVTAGADMANAFLVHLVGEDVAKTIRGVVELSARAEDEDEFASVYGLLD